jgi:hypothetical protein
VAVDSIDNREHAPEAPPPVPGRRARPTLLTTALVCVIAAALAVVGWARMNTVPEGRTYTVVEPPPAATPSPAQPLVPLLPPGPSASRAATRPTAKPARTPRNSAAPTSPSRSTRPRTAVTGAITGYLGRCLNASAAAGVPVEMATCDDGAGKVWTLAPDGTIRSEGLCLEVSGGAVTDGARVQTGTCDGTAGQQWKATAGRDIVNPRADKCLDVADFNPLPGAAVQIWTCVAGANQKWTVPGA